MNLFIFTKFSVDPGNTGKGKKTSFEKKQKPNLDDSSRLSTRARQTQHRIRFSTRSGGGGGEDLKPWPPGASSIYIYLHKEEPEEWRGADTGAPRLYCFGMISGLTELLSLSLTRCLGFNFSPPPPPLLLLLTSVRRRWIFILNVLYLLINQSAN